MAHHAGVPLVLVQLGAAGLAELVVGGVLGTAVAAELLAVLGSLGGGVLVIGVDVGNVNDVLGRLGLGRGLGPRGCP